MPKLSLEANQLVGTDVGFVSLVKRGANRIPFRITKEDKEMLDLHKIGQTLFKKSDPKPGVLAAIVRKDADVDTIKASLTAAGLEIDTVEEKDGMLVFTQKGVDEFDTGVLKVNDDLGLVVSGISKAFESYDFQSTSFGDVFATESFFPSLHMAKDMLGYTVANIMQKAETPQEAASDISKAVDEFKNYVTALATAIPVHAFKTDNETVKAAVAKAEGARDAAVKPAEAKKEEIAASPTHGNDPIDESNGATNTNIEASPAHGNDTPAASGGKQTIGVKPASNDVEGSPVAKEEGKGANAELAAMLKGIVDESLSGLRKELTDTVDDLRKDVNGVNQKLGTVAEQARKAEEAVNGTVVGNEPGGDRSPTQKSETSRGAPPLLDTAFMKADAA